MDKNYKLNIDTGQAVQNVDKLNSTLDTTIDKAEQSVLKFENITKVAAGMTGAFLAVTGAMGLMGIESEETTLMIAKLLQVMAMTEGFKAVGEGAAAFFKLLKATDATATSMSGLKKALIGTGIGLFVILIADLIANFDDLRKEFTWLDTAATALEGVWDGLIGVFKNSKEELRALGKLITSALLLPLKNIVTISKGVGEAFKKLFAGDFAGAVNSAKNTGKELKQNVLDVKDAAIEVGDSFKTGYVNGVNAAKNANKDLSKSTKLVVEDLKSEVEILMEINRLLEETGNKLTKNYLENLDVANEKLDAHIERLKEIRDELNAMSDLFDPEEDAEEITLSWLEKLQVQMQKNSKEGKEMWEAMSPADKMSTIALAANEFGSAISGFLDGVAANLDENSEEYKALAITSTVINTLIGALNAYTSAFNPLSPLAYVPGAQMALGIILAAAVVGTGAATIALIASANEGSSINSGTLVSNTVSPAAVQLVSSPEISNANIVGDSTGTSDNKVYVTETDITKTQKTRNKLKTSVKF